MSSCIWSPWIRAELGSRLARSLETVVFPAPGTPEMMRIQGPGGSTSGTDAWYFGNDDWRHALSCPAYAWTRSRGRSSLRPELTTLVFVVLREPQDERVRAPASCPH